MEKPNEEDFFSETTKFITIGLFQASLFIFLLFNTAGFFENLNWPSRVPLAQRFGNALMTVATNYLIFAYLFRQELIETVAVSSLWDWFKKMIKADMMAIVGSACFTALFFLPPFLLMLALEDTNLSNSLKSTIGFVVALVVVSVFYSRDMKKTDIATMKSRGIDAATVERLMK